VRNTCDGGGMAAKYKRLHAKLHVLLPLAFVSSLLEVALMATAARTRKPVRTNGKRSTQEPTAARRHKTQPLDGGARLTHVAAGVSALSAARQTFGPRKIVARLTGLSERTLAQLERSDQVLTTSNRRRVHELDRLRLALSEIMQPAFIRTWIGLPNDRLGGLTPIETIERGEADRLWSLIEKVRGGEPT
jgi:hypothetical protein